MRETCHIQNHPKAAIAILSFSCAIVIAMVCLLLTNQLGHISVSAIYLFIDLLLFSATILKTTSSIRKKEREGKAFEDHFSSP